MLPLANPVPTLSPAQIYVRLFCRSLVMTSLQGGGIVLFADRSWFALLTAFWIGILWTRNVTDTVDYRHPFVRLAYALGAVAGAALVLTCAAVFQSK